MDFLNNIHDQFINHKYTVVEVQVLATFITFMWFEVFNIGYKIKRKLYKKYWAFRKPWDCRFCTHFWLGLSLAPYFLINGQLFEFAFYIILNTLISKYYDTIFTNTAK